MAITYGFYNSMNGDRKYDAVQLSSIFDGVIRDGVFQSIGGYLATKPGTGMQVIVSPGKAWFDHTWTVNDADLPLDISPSDLTLSRYDAVVLETDATKAVRENSIKVVKGTPASAPQKPTLTNEGDVHQHPLAYILVPGGSSSIQAQNIEIMVGKSECPFVTSILESVSIEALLEKWEGEFRVWFDDLQDQMSGDVATNLQNQITKNAPKVGDIVISGNTSRTNEWYKCNGFDYGTENNPKLYSVLKESTRLDDAVPVVPICSSMIIAGDFALYRDKYDPDVAYLARKNKGPDFGNPLSSRDLVQSSWNDVYVSYANGYLFLINTSYSSGVVSIAYTTGGTWKKMSITPDSSVSSSDYIKYIVAIKYMSGYYYLVGTGSNTFYISVADIFSKTTYSKSDMKQIISQSGYRIFVYLNDSKNAIYVLSAETSSDGIYKISGPSSITTETFTHVRNHQYVKLFEVGGDLYAIYGNVDDTVYVAKKGVAYGSGWRLPRRSPTPVNSINFSNYHDVFFSGNDAYFQYGGYFYKFYPGMSLGDVVNHPMDEMLFPFYPGVSNEMSEYRIGGYNDSNNHYYYVDLENRIFIGSTYKHIDAYTTDIYICSCLNNSPEITPYIATEYGTAFIKGDEK